MTKIVFLSKTLFKADTAPGPNSRWITVHPHGEDSKGQPILIDPQPDGSAKVVGGAGGALNHLRLYGVKPKADYVSTLKDRAALRREEEKERVKRDKALGIHQAKTEAQGKIRAKRSEARRQFIKDAAKILDLPEGEIKFVAPEGVEPAVASRLAAQHERDLIKKIKDAVKLNRDRLLADADAQAEVSLGEILLESQGDELSVSDLDPMKLTSGLGFVPDYGRRAEASGLSPNALKDESVALRRLPTEAQRKAAIERREVAEQVKVAVEAMRDSDLQPKFEPRLVDARKAVDLIKLEKKLKLTEARASDASKEIKNATGLPKAYNLEIEDSDVDQAVREQVEQDLRTISTRGFLTTAAKIGDVASDLRGHIGVGAFNAINALALATGGDALVDRSVVDVLGIAGAAQVLAHRLQKDLSPETFADITKGMEEYHLQHYVPASKEAVAKAEHLSKEADAISLGQAENGGDLAVLQEVNRRRGEALREAQRVMGQAMGEMEANAALVLALKQGGRAKPLQVPLGHVSIESAIQQARAIGLKRGEYAITNVDGNRVLSLTPDGLSSASQAVNRDDLEQIRRNQGIMNGDLDEDGWLPDGFAKRPDLEMHVKPGISPRLSSPFEPGANLEASLHDYIGGRMADGDSPQAILESIQSQDFRLKVGSRTAAYDAAVAKLAPLQGDDGKFKPADSLRSAWEGLADDYVARKFGADRSPLHRQTFDADEHATEALHRALAENPTGVAAYKQVGELTPQDQHALREHFAKNIARESTETSTARQELERLIANEPEKETEDMFGDKSVNPDWADWKSNRDGLAEKVNSSSLNWSKYVDAMGGPANAYAAMQDSVKSDITRRFAETYNKLNPAKPLKVGRATLRGNLRHLDVVDPKARAAREAKSRELIDSMRNRVAGRYASGSVAEKLDQAREDQAGEEAAQMGLFAAPEPEANTDEPLGADERLTLGAAAEQKIAGMMPLVGENFRPGASKIDIFKPSMSGGKDIARQRAIKLIAANKRVALTFGTGSGKTAIGLGAFTQLHASGDVRRGLFLVPSIAQGQFGAEALRFLEPGKYKWSAKPGASREERIAAYKDPENHFCVMTHQSFRDDMLHLSAQQSGSTPEEVANRVNTMTNSERKDWIRGVMKSSGISFDMMNIDEGHNLLNRAGKENSNLANVIDAASDITPYYINATADPIKNDTSEAFSLLQKMDPERYSDREAFMRRYGVDTFSARDGLRRELARFQYASRIDPDITAQKSVENVDLTNGQKVRMEALNKNIAAARIGRMQGRVDVDAIKAISPSSFDGVPDDQIEAHAKALLGDISILRETAQKAILDGDPGGGKVDKISEIAAARKGKQGVVFAHSLKAVEGIKARLEADGHRVAVISGKLSAAEKMAVVDRFQGKGGQPIDVLVSSDAGSTGANIQNGRWLAQYDTPDTAMTHAQRNGRINRIGQKSNVELIDLVSNHPSERKRRDRLAKKYALRDALTTPSEGADDTGLAYFLRQRQMQKREGSLF